MVLSLLVFYLLIFQDKSEIITLFLYNRCMTMCIYLKFFKYIHLWNSYHFYFFYQLYFKSIKCIRDTFQVVLNNLYEIYIYYLANIFKILFLLQKVTFQSQNFINLRLIRSNFS